MRTHVVLAVMKRNVASYFAGPLGYLFIAVFVTAAAFFAFSDEFFANNLATLDELNKSYPLLLLFIVPAITMGTWSDERKTGTDELLFTLPATDFEILMGKYLACLAVYTVALLFSTCQLVALAWFADPDWGLMFSSYLGYWLSGAALISVGMFASAITSSATVAFVLGAVLCAVPILISRADPSSQLLKTLSLDEQFREFGLGTIPLSSVIYFVSLSVFMLYLNLVMITKRHWSTGQKANMGLQFVVRTVALAGILISLNVVTNASGGLFSLQQDMTAEQVFSLSATTDEIIDKIPEDDVVTMQAFLSPQVPPEYVTTHKRLVGLLRQYDRKGGSSINVRFVDVEGFSDEAEEAALYGINPRQVQSETGGRTSVEDVFLGVVISSANDEVVIPFFEPGLPAEYELTRSIRTVSKQDRMKIGILQTDAQIEGGFDQQRFSQIPEWQIVRELKKQYEVESVSPDTPIKSGEFKVLIAALPSSLTEPQLKNLVDYVKAGNPTLILDDPMPVTVGPQAAPRSPKPRQGGGGMFGGGGPPPEQKADGGKLTSLLDELGISWDYDRIVFDSFNPHPNIDGLVRSELVWISDKSGTNSAFSSKSVITDGLQEMLLFFPGQVMKRSGSDFEFEPLLATTPESGVLDWDEFTQPSFFGGVGLNPNPTLEIDEPQHALAAHVKSKEEGGINVVFVADLDCISDAMFDIIRNERFDLKLDNVTFILNAVDLLAGDEAYIDLRKRRQEHRTLVKVQEAAEEYRKNARKALADAEEEAEEELEKRKEQFEARKKAIDENEALTEIERDRYKMKALEDEQQRLKVAEENIERSKQNKIAELKKEEQRDILKLEHGMKAAVVLLSPLPAILLGLFVLISRMLSENMTIDPKRRI